MNHPPQIGEVWKDSEDVVVKVMDISYEERRPGPVFGQVYYEFVGGALMGRTHSMWKQEFVRRFEPVRCEDVHAGLQCQSTLGHTMNHRAGDTRWEYKGLYDHRKADLRDDKPKPPSVWRSSTKPFRFVALGNGGSGGIAMGWTHYAAHQSPLNSDLLVRLSMTEGDGKLLIRKAGGQTEEERLAYYGLKPERPQAVFDVEGRWNDADYRASYYGLKK